ncbi:MAG: carbamoyltransferase HypF [Chloroflexi bacterium]|nr:carbamoyltransferase HypF [Chloroflexota bacterium]
MPLCKIHVTGVVQGVGFRPFVYQLATRANLCGWIANTSSGVEIEIEGDDAALDAFVRALQDERPPLARIDSLHVESQATNGDGHFSGFEIRASLPQPGAFQPISPDISICPDCLRELFDPNDRRYRYPFINCTNCGPRFTIIHDIPYDRPLTTMRAFPMCDDCAREYHDPSNRRFHAQPVACPKCGPKVWLASSRVQLQDSELGTWNREPRTRNGDPIERAQQLLAQGGIVAVKGLGGFHLACDATSDRAVETLRERKGRVDKPFAIMAYDVAAVEELCYVSEAERALLESRERPIVLLRRRAESHVSERVAPNNQFLGVMLPYTPLHYLLLNNRLQPTEDRAERLVLVMTSGNLAEEPIATDNADALERLAPLADYFLLHDRDIETRADDSVVCLFEDHELPIRRSRGYAPYPVHLPFRTRPTLAVGAELKNTFCLARDQYAFVSQHIGDLENYSTLQSFAQQIEHFKRLFRVQPEVIAYDLHPEYLSTKYARAQDAGFIPPGTPRRGSRGLGRDLRSAPEFQGFGLGDKSESLKLVPVQHHHAHIAACMAENRLGDDEPVLGIAFDGTGYGTDGKIWGGEFLLARYAEFTRAAHLAYVPLPGGDAAIKRVYRIGLAHLAQAGMTWEQDLPCAAIISPTERDVIRHQLDSHLNAPDTSSMGRLFDAVAAIIGVREVINYEAQAAIELENWVVEGLEGIYDFGFMNSDFGSGNLVGLSILKSEIRNPKLVVDPAPVIRSIVMDYRKQVPPWVIATKFHNGVAEMVRVVATELRTQYGVNRVALSGGVFQNVTLLSRTLARLRDAGFEVYTHHLVPPNDAGISLGQAAVAAHAARAAPPTDSAK